MSVEESELRRRIFALLEELPDVQRDLARAIIADEPGSGRMFPHSDGTVTVTIGTRAPMVLGTVTVPGYDHPEVASSEPDDAPLA